MKSQTSAHDLMNYQLEDAKLKPEQLNSFKLTVKPEN